MKRILIRSLVLVAIAAVTAGVWWFSTPTAEACGSSGAGEYCECSWETVTIHVVNGKDYLADCLFERCFSSGGQEMSFTAVECFAQ